MLKMSKRIKGSEDLSVPKFATINSVPDFKHTKSIMSIFRQCTRILRATTPKRGLVQRLSYRQVKYPPFSSLVLEEEDSHVLKR